MTLEPEAYREQHKQRLSWMPWLYFSLKAQHRAWAEPWQQALQANLMTLETVEIGPGCFISPDARIFGEPGRAVQIGPGCSVAAQTFLHGPLELGAHVSINARVSLDGGRGGIVVGSGTRVATGVTVYAFNHGMDPARLVRDQPVTSAGVRIGEDVWIGANAGITDGVTVGDHAVVGMGAVVTRDVAAYAVVGGVPARVLGDRRHWTGGGGL